MTFNNLFKRKNFFFSRAKRKMEKLNVGYMMVMDKLQQDPAAFELVKQQLFRPPSASIAEAFSRKWGPFAEGTFDNIGAWGWAILIFASCWIVAIFVSWLLWVILMFNWRKLLCGWGKGKDGLIKKMNDHDESTNKPGVVPVAKGTPGGSVNPHDPSSVKSPFSYPVMGNPSPTSVTSTTVGSYMTIPMPNQVVMAAVPPLEMEGKTKLFKRNYQNNRSEWDPVGKDTPTVVNMAPESERSKQEVHYKVRPAINAPDYNRFTGHERTRYESYVRLIVLSVRVLIVCAGVTLAFQAAGVNILSLFASLGVVSVCFSYGAAPIITNILCAIYMYGTDKVEMGDYIQIGGIYGFVTALRAQWIELTDDLSPLQGIRRIHQIPNRLPMETIITRYPNGPPPAILMKYFEELEQVNKFRREILKLEPIESLIPW